MTPTVVPRPDETPLERRLIELIRASGPMTVADYMTDALGHPQYGYYMSRDPIGAAGDFTTAPEVSQMFGEAIGAWLVDSWRAMGEPERVNLVELGPGRGVLMADILRVARLRPAFLAAVDVFLVETSGRLRFEQERRLRQAAVQPTWLHDLSEAPPAPTLLVANEFFDCLPVRQYVRTRSAWRERLVGLDKEGLRLAFTLAGVNVDRPDGAPDWVDDAEPGAIFETSAEARDAAREICDMLVENGGRALVIDYGHAAAGVGETLQAVRAHAYWPPLAAPGEADLTAHVDFSALARAAVDAGACVYGPTPQGVFLRRLGILERAAALKAKADDAGRAEIDAALDRLCSEDQMGVLFKAMCFSAPGLPPAPGLEVL